MTFPKLLALITAALAFTASTATAAIVVGLENGGASIGQYDFRGRVFWWVGVDPGAAPLDNSTLITAQVHTVADGWLLQDDQRTSEFNASSPGGAAVLAKQVAIVEYVLDTFLPWDTLAGASGRFLEQSGDYHNYSTDDPFLNAMFAAQAFIAQTVPRYTQLDFTNLSDYTDTFAGLGDATDDARSALFQSILTDVAARDASGTFASYSALHNFSIVNVPGDPVGGYMDGLIIGPAFAPVPEPRSALLIATCGLGWVLRRRRVAK